MESLNICQPKLVLLTAINISNLKGENIMWMFTNVIIIIGLSSLFLTSCSIEKFWNGYYALEQSMKEGKEYYDKETSQQKKQRIVDDNICSDKYGITIVYSDGRRGRKGDTNSYLKCMRERGSPLFGH